MGKSSFFSLWKQLFPTILTCRPMTDLCFDCQQNITVIYRSINIPEEEKRFEHLIGNFSPLIFISSFSERLRQQEQHLKKVRAERAFYNKMVEDSREVCRQLDVCALQANAPCSRNVAMHYSFDFAQQVHLPSNPLQPGPIYFLTPRKCGIFGVCCEGIPWQVNFLVDEAHSAGKGSNCVVSYLHYFFESFGLGETTVHLHCDNCAGQNKNKFMLWYLAWRVVTGLHEVITLNFMIKGHTKFLPDSGFGLLKQEFRRSVVSSLECMASVVNRSASCNMAQLVGLEDGTCIVPNYDWQQFLTPHGRALPGIKKMHHFRSVSTFALIIDCWPGSFFRFEKTRPGTVMYKDDLEDEWQEFVLIPQPEKMLPAKMPKQVPPPGLSLQRQQYLHQQIRPFVEEQFRDVLCPAPVTPSAASKRGPSPTPRRPAKRR